MTVSEIVISLFVIFIIPIIIVLLEVFSNYKNK